jgi:CRP-like cAMP-binding protein
LGSTKAKTMSAAPPHEATALFPSRSKLNRRHQNFLLSQVPLPERERLIGECDRITSPTGSLVYPQSGTVSHVYFPLTGIISMVRTSQDGTDSIEAGMVGNEGMAGLSGFFGIWKSPTKAVWQVGGEAYRMSAEALQRAVLSIEALRWVLGRYAQALLTQTIQSILCNNSHPVEQRLCRWLLMTHDRLGLDHLPLTQEFVAQMLGTRRPSVTVAAGMLQKAGMITYRRGDIRMVDRASMEKGACECHDVVRRESEAVLLAN